MDVFALRQSLVDDYRHYAESFLTIRDERIRSHVQKELDDGLLWPDPPLQLNPAFASGGTVDELVGEGLLHEECRRIFRGRKSEDDPVGVDLRLHRHQADAIRAAKRDANYVLTTGTGSGKSLSYIVPIVDYALRNNPGDGRIKAIVVYPMNALANSQEIELGKFLGHGYPTGKPPVTFRRFTGQETEEQREEMRKRPPDILLTNYVMLEYLLTRPVDEAIVRAADGLPFLVLDELHTYRGRQGADVAMLVRRVRERCRATALRCVGTSATMAGPGTYEEQQAQVAEVASRLFGTDVLAKDVIGETLEPATAEVNLNDEQFRVALTQRVADGSPAATYVEMAADPLASWIERTLGIVFNETDQRYTRCLPRPIRGPDGAAAVLSRDTGVAEERCEQALRSILLASDEARDGAGFPVFAFRLHQFFSGGNRLAASLDPPEMRHISTSGQQFVPGSGRDRVMLEMAFCRECGEEYFPVRRSSGDEGVVFTSRDVGERAVEGDHQRLGFLHVPHHDSDGWPEAEADQHELLPPDWFEPGTNRVKRDRRKRLPEHVGLSADGAITTSGGLRATFIPAPFLFCLSCGVAYGARQTSDFGKLSTLGAGGRSTGTTVLGLAAVRSLRQDTELDPEARKLLSFSDNRQDASLQAGHFNDFVEIGLLRAALHEAAQRCGPGGLRFDALPAAVFDALALAPELYASDPTVKGGAKRRVDESLKEVLAYRVYRDQRRGWRLTSPNLEQTGLLRVDYADLDECLVAEDVWTADLPTWAGVDETEPHPALVSAEPATRGHIARALLDWMRRELAIKVGVLDAENQDQLRQRAGQRLVAPWAIDETEPLEYASVVFPRSRQEHDDRSATYLGPLGGFGLFLGRDGTLPLHPGKLTLVDRRRIIAGVLEALRQYGLIEEVARGQDDVPGFQVLADELVWLAADGTQAGHDPIRVPRASSTGGKTNRFFVDLYRNDASQMRGLEAREHTAQVKPLEREKREARFRTAELPVLFCSPTMELGVDIASLNVVNMRNVPPTPANYAQRSGRAGRNRQPALVYTFCSSMSAHDQWFFRRPERMVAGAVAPPQLDLANEELVRAHVHAIWLAETGQSLRRSLTELLDVEGEEPTLELVPSIRNSIASAQARDRARGRAREVLDAMQGDLDRAAWWDDGWVDRVVAQAPTALDAACDRWRDLYRSALATQKAQSAIITDASKSRPAKEEAKRIRREAEAQLELLAVEGSDNASSDFYSYRYFASEGFLPGYSFPRLPLSAFIPGRRFGRRADEDFVQRPRFLAITEFGPRSIVYHEGARYLVNKVILPVERDPESGGLPTERAKVCEACGSLHPVREGEGVDVCERCGAVLPHAMTDLLRLQNVATRRRDRISSDEEERQRQGYEVRTAVQVDDDATVAEVHAADGAKLLELEWGQAATIWRVNLGWTRRKERDVRGFVLDTERGYWATDEKATPDDPTDPLSNATRRVIPYVEDRRNCLLIQPATGLPPEEMATLQAALKRAIQIEFQLEDQELASEPLPGPDVRNRILIFEAAEGGAGALRRLIEDGDALRRVAAAALDLCHFDSGGADRNRAKHATEDCELACYDCLLSYGNQRDHRLLDRHGIRGLLMELGTSTITTVRGGRPPVADHAEHLKRRADSSLERHFVDVLVAQGRRLPDDQQRLITGARARPDFLYTSDRVAVFVDGPVHDETDRQAEDADTTARLEDAGWEVVRFHHADIERWGAIMDGLPGVFGTEGS